MSNALELPLSRIYFHGSKVFEPLEFYFIFLDSEYKENYSPLTNYITRIKTVTRFQSYISKHFFRSNRPGYPHPVSSELENSGIRVAVGDCSVTERRRWRPPYQTGKTAHVHAKTLQTQRGRTHGAGCVRQWFRTAEPLGERRYENWNTHTKLHNLELSCSQNLIEILQFSGSPILHLGAASLFTAGRTYYRSVSFRNFVDFRNTLTKCILLFSVTCLVKEFMSGDNIYR